MNINRMLGVGVLAVFLLTGSLSLHGLCVPKNYGYESVYSNFVKNHEKELNCLLLKVYKYFRKVETPDARILEKAKGLPQKLREYENLGDGYSFYRDEKLIRDQSEECQCVLEGFPMCPMTPACQLELKELWSETMSEPGPSEKEVMDFLKGFSMEKFRERRSIYLPGQDMQEVHYDYIIQEKFVDRVAGIEAVYSRSDSSADSMTCVPLRNIDVESALDRIFEILEDAQEYCEKTYDRNY